MTCLIAAGVNVFTCFLIGKTSAVLLKGTITGCFLLNRSMIGSLPGNGAFKNHSNPRWRVLVLRSRCERQKTSGKLHRSWYVVCMSSLLHLDAMRSGVHILWILQKRRFERFEPKPTEREAIRCCKVSTIIILNFKWKCISIRSTYVGILDEHKYVSSQV